jgi:hypothetical protein
MGRKPPQDGNSDLRVRYPKVVRLVGASDSWLFFLAISMEALVRPSEGLLLGVVVEQQPEGGLASAAVMSEVDDDLAVHVPAGLKFDRLADLLEREGCRDRHTEVARRHQASDLGDRASGGVGTVDRRHPVDSRGDRGDALT